MKKMPEDDFISILSHYKENCMDSDKDEKQSKNRKNLKRRWSENVESYFEMSGDSPTGESRNLAPNEDMIRINGELHGESFEFHLINISDIALTKYIFGKMFDALKICTERRENCHFCEGFRRVYPIIVSEERFFACAKCYFSNFDFSLKL